MTDLRNNESYIHFQALENNAIPIIVREPWLAGVFGQDTRYPFIVLDVRSSLHVLYAICYALTAICQSWDEVGPRIDALAAEDPAVGQARQAVSIASKCPKWVDHPH